jgi:hypothetical protein
MGSYDNLKSFGIARLEMEKKRSGAPTPRVFSDSLIQSVPVTLMPAFDKLYENWRDDLMPASTHIDALLESPENLHFTRPEIYKHYFEVFSKLVSGLPVNVKDRMEHIDSKAKKGIALFESITEKGIVLDANSGGDHLIAWRNTIAMLRK